VPLTHAGRILFCSSVAEPAVGAFVTNPQCRRPSLRVHGRVAYPPFADVVRSVSLWDGASASKSRPSAQQWSWTRNPVSATGRVRGRDFYVKRLTLQ
jgi:hypothetical protein